MYLLLHPIWVYGEWMEIAKMAHGTKHQSSETGLGFRSEDFGPYPSRVTKWRPKISEGLTFDEVMDKANSSLDFMISSYRKSVVIALGGGAVIGSLAMWVVMR